MNEKIKIVLKTTTAAVSIVQGSLISSSVMAIFLQGSMKYML
jgi:hypothetical protein